ncbi:gamma hydroxybutyrate dehydrogenase [Trichoderma arundinaceum]|uniref:Gamma hydroxybutyrate dehydrogenase n=1 Tax=Trichoderma arundinaceum TaxID=490622 RepID=A0A395NJC6_TRIAR|nr:gamma hydroxybutyrate dehydrogenase [Trichoderma arundinaceum]
MSLGFLGLGIMGTPMALNLCRKFPVIVWSRSDSQYNLLKEAGAIIGETPSRVVEQCDLIFMMLFDSAAIQSMIDGDDDFLKAIYGKTLINMSSVPVDYSHELAEHVHKAGGKFIEMPVSGSRLPAEQGQLVGMLAGDRTVIDQIRPFIEPITSAAVYCGPIGSGLKAKYAVNLFLVSVTAGLAESMNLARAQGLDLASFGEVLNACPLASAYSKVKIAKILNGDWSPQAAIKDCYNSTQLIQSAAQEVQVQTPLIEICRCLYRDACISGWDEEDMIAIYKLFT